MNKYFVIILLLLGITNISMAKEGFLSSYWHQLPEDKISGSIDKSRNSRDLHSIDSFLNNFNEAQLDAFDDFEADKSINKASGKKGWKLKGFQTSLALGLSGKLGILTFGGTKTIEIDWARRTKKEVIEEKTEVETTIALDSTTSKKEMHKELEPIIQHLVNSKKVTDKKELRKNLLATANQFHAFAQGLNEVPKNKWAASKIRLDLSISASGKVAAPGPLVKVGGDIRLRLEWVRLMKSTDDKGRRTKISEKDLSKAEKKIASATKDLFNNLAVEVTGAYEGLKDEEKYDQYGFAVESIEVGIGFSLEGKIGIASLKGGVTPSVFFGKHEGGYDLKESNKSTKGSINLIVDNRAANYDYAKSAKISYDKGIKDSIFKMKRARVRKGIKKALRFGLKFAKKFNKKKDRGRRWGVKKIKSQYKFSLAGTVGPVKLNATPHMSIYFKNKSL